MSNPEKWRGFAQLPPDIADRLACLPAFFADHGVHLAYLFGSLAQATAGSRAMPANDVDLAILTAPGVSVYSLDEPIRDCLAIERLDLIDLRRASAELRFAVISEGRCLFAAGDDERLSFELATIRAYHDRAYVRRLHEQLLRERLAQWS